LHHATLLGEFDGYPMWTWFSGFMGGIRFKNYIPDFAAARVKVEDPGGTQGWMLGKLVSDTRTGLVMGNVAELLDAPRFGGRVVWRAAPGVVGRLSKCANGWCYFDVRGRGGYVEANHLWGVAPDETLG